MNYFYGLGFFMFLGGILLGGIYFVQWKFGPYNDMAMSLFFAGYNVFLVLLCISISVIANRP